MPDQETTFDRRRLLRFTEHDIERRKAFVALGPGDAALIASVRDLIAGNADRFTALFIAGLEGIPEAAGLFERRDGLEEAKRLMRQHLASMASGEYGIAYAEQVVKLAILFNRVGLATRLFLGAFHGLMRVIGLETMERFGPEISATFDSFMALKKVWFFDIGIMMDVMIDERERVIDERERIISAQQDAIRELSTPVLQLRDHLLVLPIIGVMDTQRAKQMTDNLLHAIRANRAKVVVIDVTGVATVDSKVANHLIQTVAAAGLMGASVIVTGLSAGVALSLVDLGVDLGKLRTVGDLQGGLEEAERLLGYRVAQLAEPGTRLDPS